MAHDLKAPLYNISAFAGLIKKQITNGFHKEKVSKYINFIDNSSESMAVLIEDLLLYSKIDMEELDFSNVHLNDLVDLVLPVFSYDINAGSTAINIKELPTIHGNKSLLKTVFHNLISNGIKYQPKDQPNHQAQIDIWSAENDKQYCIFIQDNGIGIKSEHVNEVFKPFVRFHSSKEYSGTGLGMSICRRIMKNHNGSVELDQTSNKGSRFKLTFPKMENAETAITTNSVEILS